MCVWRRVATTLRRSAVQRSRRSDGVASWVRCWIAVPVSHRITYQGGKMKRVVCSLALVSAFSLAGLTACGDKVNVVQAGPDSSVTSVTVTPPSANLNVGDKVTFTATVTGGSGLTNRNVTWSSSTPSVATVDATSGVVTAVGGGTTSIIATSSANSSVRGAAAVTVAAAVQPTVTIST